jgi:hypothetical protein
MRFIALLIVILLGAFTGTALAADAVAASDQSMSETARMVFDAIMSGHWWAAVAYGVILTVALTRRYAFPASWKEGVRGDIVGTAVAFVLAFAGAIATTAAAPGAAMTGAVIMTALKIGAVAIGGYTVVHKVVSWFAAWSRTPTWLLAVLKVAAMLVGSNAIAKAKAAGDAAVAANPPTGLAGNDTIREVE